MIKKFLSYRGFVCLGSCPSVLVCVPPRRCRAPLRVRARWPRLRGSVAPGLGFVLRRVSCPRCLRSWVLLSSVLGAAVLGLGCCRLRSWVLPPSPGRAHRAGLGSCPLPAPKKNEKNSTFFVERIDVFLIFVLGIKGLHYPLHILTHR